MKKFLSCLLAMAILCVCPRLQRPGFRRDPQEKNPAGASVKGLCVDAGDY